MLGWLLLPSRPVACEASPILRLWIFQYCLRDGPGPSLCGFCVGHQPEGLGGRRPPGRGSGLPAGVPAATVRGRRVGRPRCWGTRTA